MATKSARSHVRPAIATLVGGLAGAVVGLIVGANIGGNWMTSISVGTLHGYEVTGMLGVVLGALGGGAAFGWFALRRRDR